MAKPLRLAEFESFYRANVDRIYRYVFFRVGQSHETAEDLVSEIFLKAFTHFEKYDPAISKSAWIYRIAHNRLANHYRDTKVASDIDDMADMLPGEDGRRALEQIGDRKQLQELLNQLEDSEREVVMMKYLEGYSYKEMAEILEKSVDALKVATHRAMKKLKSYA